MQTTAATAVASFTISNIYHYFANQGSFGSGSVVTNQYGFYVENTLIGATNNYGFYGNIATSGTSGSVNWNLYMNGTAPNYLAGPLGIGTTNFTGYSLRISKNITGATTAYGVYQDSTIQSDVTTQAFYYSSFAQTQAAAFSTSIRHFFARQGTIGTGSSVVDQWGFYVENTLIGATNNYGFFGNIASGSNRWNLYMNGTAPNYLSGSLGIGNTSPTAKLHVSGAVLFENDNDAIVTIKSRTNAFNPTLRFQEDTAIIRWQLIAAESDGGKFKISGSGAGEALTIVSNNNVGIGTTSPSVKLDISGSATVSGSLIVVNDITGSNALFSGTITAQTLVVQTVSSSIIYSSGSNIFGNLLTNNQIFTGSVLVTGSITVATPVVNNLTASYAMSASQAIYASTASYAQVFNVGGAQMQYATATNPGNTNTNIFTTATGSFTSAFYNYTTYSGSNTRAGQVIAAWNGNTTTYTDFSTVDIGNTSMVTASVAIVTGQVQFNIQVNAANAWNIKSTVQYL
jgi:hypothetical protein